MPKKNGDLSHRAWSLLRLALLWGRKGGVFKRRLMMELRVLPKYLKNLAHNTTHSDKIRYGERELSFDKTPIFHVKMHRPASMSYLIPCITSRDQVDFDYEFDRDYEDDNHDCGRKSFLKDGQEEEEENGYGDDCKCEDKVPLEEQGIDSRAEEFIAKFYEQIKMQRQISYLQYNEMINGGTI